MDQNYPLHPLIQKHIDAPMVYAPALNPDVVVFANPVGISWACIPFLQCATLICVMVKETEDEAKRLGVICANNRCIRNQGAVVLSLRWLLDNHRNIKVFVCERRGCCCTSRSKGTTRQILARGEDFECSDGFSLF